MSAWICVDRARNIGTKSKPHYVAVWWGSKGTGLGHRVILGGHANPTIPNGMIYAQDGGPQYYHPTNFKQALERYREIADL